MATSRSRDVRRRLWPGPRAVPVGRARNPRRVRSGGRSKYSPRQPWRRHSRLEPHDWLRPLAYPAASRHTGINVSLLHEQLMRTLLRRPAHSAHAVSFRLAIVSGIVGVAVVAHTQLAVVILLATIPITAVIHASRRMWNATEDLPGYELVPELFLIPLALGLAPINPQVSGVFGGLLACSAILRRGASVFSPQFVLLSLAAIVVFLRRRGSPFRCPRGHLRRGDRFSPRQ